MTRYTIIADMAGKLARVTTNPRVTVAAVAFGSEDVERIRQSIPADLPKWALCSLAQAEMMADFIAHEAVAVAALSTLRDTPEWDAFWQESAKLQAAITRQDRKKAGFVKAANVTRCALFGWVVTLATAHAIKIAPRTRLLNSRGLEIIEQDVIFDADVSGDENIEVFRSLWTERRPQPKTNSIGLELLVRDCTLANEQDEPVILLPDYLAGMVHCSRISDPRTLPLPLTQQQAHNCVARIDTLGKAEIYRGAFNLKFREMFGEVMSAAGI